MFSRRPRIPVPDPPPGGCSLPLSLSLLLPSRHQNEHEIAKLPQIICARYQESRVFASFPKKISGARVLYATVKPTRGIELPSGGSAEIYYVGVKRPIGASDEAVRADQSRALSGVSVRSNGRRRTGD